MKFSIIVPCYNEEENIGRCLTSLLSQNYTQKEIIIVDDASEDRTFEIASRFSGEGVTLIPMKAHKGKVRALNEALKIASGDVIVVLDGDCVVESNWLRHYKEDFANKDVVAVGGGLKGKSDEGFWVSCSILLDVIHHRFLGKFLLPCKLSGSNFAVRTKDLLAIGGFDETKWPGEDLDIYMKLKKRGNVVFNPSNAVWTPYPKTFKEVWLRKFWWGYGCGLLVGEKLLGKPSLWLRPVYFVMLLLGVFFFLLPFTDSTKKYISAMLIGLMGPLFVFYPIMSFMASFFERNMKYLTVSLFLPLFLLWRELGYFFGFIVGITKSYK